MVLLGGQFKSATHGQFKSAQGGQFDRNLQAKGLTNRYDRLMILFGIRNPSLRGDDCKSVSTSAIFCTYSEKQNKSIRN